jgi:hypothetical protein
VIVLLVEWKNQFRAIPRFVLAHASARQEVDENKYRSEAVKHDRGVVSFPECFGNNRPLHGANKRLALRLKTAHKVTHDNTPSASSLRYSPWLGYFSRRRPLLELASAPSRFPAQK